MTSYLIGQRIRLSNTFTLDAVASDPTTVSCSVLDPSGATTVYSTLGVDIIKDSTGNYHLDLTVSIAGSWEARWIGTGTVPAVAESIFTVTASALTAVAPPPRPRTGHIYAGRNALKVRIGIGSLDTADDATLDAILLAVSRLIDNETHRNFYPTLDTLYFDANSWARVLVEDLIAVTSLATDDNADRTYISVWAATDYDLDPYNARTQAPPEPYLSISVTPRGKFAFSTINKGVKIVGTWGYFDERVTSPSALTGSMTSGATTASVTAGVDFDVNQTILIDTEQLLIVAILSNTLTVQRGQNGTTAAAHNNAAAIDVYQYPVVSEACLIQATRVLKRKDTPFGLAGLDTGAVRLPRLDPDVTMMLSPFRKPVVS